MFKGVPTEAPVLTVKLYSRHTLGKDKEIGTTQLDVSGHACHFVYTKVVLMP